LFGQLHLLRKEAFGAYRPYGERYCERYCAESDRWDGTSEHRRHELHGYLTHHLMVRSRTHRSLPHLDRVQEHAHMQGTPLTSVA
jgi:hypothetical protein